MKGSITFLVVFLLMLANTITQAQKNNAPNYKALQSRPLYKSLQQTLERLSRTETDREEASLAGKQGVEMDPIRQQCRVAISGIRNLQTQIAKLLSQTYERRPSQRDKNSWTVRELESLGRNLKVQLARAYRNQALCYPATSADHVNALSLALEQISQIASQPIDEQSVWQARLEQIVCLRLSKKHAQATKLVEHWLSLSPPATVESQLEREKIYLELDAGNLTFALAHQDLTLLNYAAARLYASGKLNESVATYDRIATLQAAQNRTEQQFQALKTSAAIVREQEQLVAALSRFRQLAQQHPQHDEAASVHLIAIGIAAQLVRKSAPEERNERFERYLVLLKEHLLQWPEQPSAKRAQRWLEQAQHLEVQRNQARTLATQGERAQALAIYRNLLQGAPNDAQLVETYAELLSKSADKSELREALRVWLSLEKRSKPGGPRWWRGRRARLTLLDSLGERGQAKKLRQLTKILYSEKQASPTPKSGEPRPQTGEPRP